MRRPAGGTPSPARTSRATVMPGVPGSNHPQFIDVAHREHAVARHRRGPRPRRPWACGACRRSPGRSTAGWVLAANIAADAGRLVRLLGLLRRPGPARTADTGNAPGYRDPGTSPPAWPATPASRALKDQPGLALEGRVPRLLAAALRPASTRLTSTISPSDTKGGTARRGRSRCAPGHPGHHHATAPRKQTDSRPETGHPHNQ